MARLDNRTILFVAAVVYFLLAAAMVAAAVLLKKYRGPVYWAIGACGWPLVTSLLYLQGWVSPWLTLVIPNIGVIASLCLISHGAVVFLEERPRIPFYLAACLFSLIGFVYFGIYRNSFQARVVIASLMQSLILCDLSLLLFGKLKHRKQAVTIFALLSCFVPAVIWTIRAVVAMVIAPPQDLLQSHWFFSGTLVIYILGAIALCLSLVLLASSRFARELEEGRLQLIQANQQLREALASVKTLTGLLPICAHCKKIRDDQGYWQQTEAYIREHSDATFSHGICPSCAAKLFPGLYPESEKIR